MFPGTFSLWGDKYLIDLPHCDKRTLSTRPKSMHTIYHRIPYPVLLTCKEIIRKLVCISNKHRIFQYWRNNYYVNKFTKKTTAEMNFSICSFIGVCKFVVLVLITCSFKDVRNSICSDLFNCLRSFCAIAIRMENR